jgi:hypothetical protein
MKEGEQMNELPTLQKEEVAIPMRVRISIFIRAKA